MARAMFNYTVQVLEKVSFDVSLFAKEVEKALTVLLPHEIEELKIFIRQMVVENPQLKSCII